MEKRNLRIGAIQLSIVAAASDTADVQGMKRKMLSKVEKLVEAASLEGVNILCFPEMWYLPYPFYTPDEIDWRQSAEEMNNGISVNAMKDLASKFRVLIISPILERENGIFYNTCVLISTSGEVIGKYRKSHIPPIEFPYLKQGPFDHPVFETEFGRIGILICYERHFPLNWMMLGLNGAQIVFNPSSEVENSFSERLWFVEARTAAAANGFFTVSVNRSGTEKFKSGSFFTYFGSNYIASPDGFMTDSLPPDCDGLLVAEIDLNTCQRVKDEFSFHQNQHLEVYSKKLASKALN